MFSARMAFGVISSVEGIHSLRNLNPSPCKWRPCFQCEMHFQPGPASEASEIQGSFGKKFIELQKAVTEPEGCQDEASMGRIYLHRSQRKFSKLALNMLWLLICSLQTSWCVATIMRLKKQAKEVKPFSTEGTVIWLVWLIPLYEVWSQSMEGKDWREKGSWEVDESPGGRKAGALGEKDARP